MCLTTNNPSDPCCETTNRCVACPQYDWSQNTFLLSYDAYRSSRPPYTETYPAFERKMTTLTGCEWQVEMPAADPPEWPSGSGVEYEFTAVHLLRSRSFYDVDGQLWRLYFGSSDDNLSIGPYVIDPFLCDGEMTVTRSQDRWDELDALYPGEIADIDRFPETIRLRRVSGRGPDLNNPFSLMPED